MTEPLPMADDEKPPRPDRCETCRFVEALVERIDDTPACDRAYLCHRFPPVWNDIHEAWYFPAVEYDEWCGEWKAKDT